MNGLGFDAGACEPLGCRNLAALLRLSTQVCSSLSLQPTLDSACQAAVELFGVYHSGLALINGDLEEGIVEAEYPRGVGAIGRRIQMGVATLERRSKRQDIGVADLVRCGIANSDQSRRRG
jgi:hypothetical protein